MTARYDKLVRCWWCGHLARVDSASETSNGMLRDDSTFDASESWICVDNAACNARGKKIRG